MIDEPGHQTDEPLTAVMAGQVAQHLGLHGPSIAPANACATGAHAIALGGMFLRSGEADLAICGGAESAFTPLIVNGFASMKAVQQAMPSSVRFWLSSTACAAPSGFGSLGARRDACPKSSSASSSYTFCM